MDRAQVVFGVTFALLFFLSYFILRVVWNILYLVTEHIPVIVFFLLVMFIVLPVTLILSREFTKHF
ncbi:hypothetical protein, partial [Planococcus sp. CAU13]|uniref:hypothetical protein n=1 Tax=Planococcus sp. CAU13 TaxID=1541197 RepID=UPI00052FED6A